MLNQNIGVDNNIERPERLETDNDKDILILELQDDLYRSEKEKNEIYLTMSKSIQQKESKIKELQARLTKEMQFFDESKQSFDESIRKCSLNNPSQADTIKQRKE